jgi:hypothetical protein
VSHISPDRILTGDSTAIKQTSMYLLLQKSASFFLQFPSPLITGEIRTFAAYVDACGAPRYTHERSGTGKEKSFGFRQKRPRV